MSLVFCVKDPVYNIFLDLYPCSPFLKAEHRRGRGTGWRRCWQGGCGDDRAPRGRAGKACRGSGRDSSGTGAFRRLQAAGRPAPTTAGGGAKGQRGCCDAETERLHGEALRLRLSRPDSQAWDCAPGAAWSHDGHRRKTRSENGSSGVAAHARWEGRRRAVRARAAATES